MKAKTKAKAKKKANGKIPSDDDLVSAAINWWHHKGCPNATKTKRSTFQGKVFAISRVCSNPDDCAACSARPSGNKSEVIRTGYDKWEGPLVILRSHIGGQGLGEHGNGWGLHYPILGLFRWKDGKITPLLVADAEYANAVAGWPS